MHDAYDPELGFLRTLEREVTRRAIAVQSASARRGVEARETKRALDLGLRPAGTRMARRSLALVALLCLIGASAYGAGRILSGGDSNLANVRQGAFIEVAQGRSGPDSWSLRLYVRGGEFCRVLVVANTESSRCSTTPRGGALGVTSVVSASRRYAYGVTGAGVARVAIRAGEDAVSVPTHAPAAAAVSAAGLPAGVRWFVAVLRRPVGEPDPRALVRGLDAAGRATGPALGDCAETPEPAPCPR
jgi:hypothetical protein